MNCPNCGEPNSDYLESCRRCGLNLQPFQSLKNLRGRIEQTRRSVSEMLEQLHGEVEKTESAVTASLQAAKKPAPVEEPVIAAAPPQLPPKPVLSAPASPPPPVKLPPKKSSSEINIGQRWLLIAGVIIIVIAVGLFLKYAFESNRVGPVARVGLSYLTGFAFLGLGELFRRKKFEGF